MDENNDGTLTEEEFLKGCLQDDELSKMLAPNVSGWKHKDQQNIKRNKFDIYYKIQFQFLNEKIFSWS